MPRTHPNYSAHRQLNWCALWLTAFAENAQWSSGWFWGLGVLNSALMTLMQLCDPQGQPFAKPWDGIAVWVYGHRFWLALLLLALQMTAGAIVLFLKRFQPFERTKVEDILEAALRHHFPERDVAQHVYRATLFKIRRFPMCGKWLGIVCRSGENYRQSNTVLSLNRMSQQECTGVAGECARQDAAIIVGPLDPKSPDYLESGWIAECEHSAFNVRATVFLGTPVRRQDGKQWGVLVLDTTDPECAPGAAQSNRSPKKLETDLTLFALALKTAIRS
ncbi:MAG: hypothetical protein SFV23_12125 [Planctomycetaceae bacterium]|nr:hypothetical protein [Planctomycetaceae bacterium]